MSNKINISVEAATQAASPAVVVNDDGSRMPVGVTVIAGMKVCGGKDTFIERVVHSLSDAAIRSVEKSARLRAGTVQIIESLIWPFVVRELSRSATNQVRSKFQVRMTRSVQHLVRMMLIYESEDNREQSYVKYWTDCAMCMVFQDTQRPVRPEWLETTHPLFSGYMARGVRGAIAKRNIGFIYSLSKGSKRLWPALGELKLNEALEDHKRRIGTDFRGTVPEPLLDLITQISSEVFSRRRMGLATKILPSMHACLQASRRSGGASTLFSALDTEVVQLGPAPDSLQIAASVEHQLNFSVRRYLTHQLNAWRQLTWSTAYEQAMKRLDQPVMGRINAFGEHPSHSPALQVEVAAVPEPGKFRIITKGDGYLYTALQPLQGQLLSAWKSTRYSTMSDNDLTEKIRCIDAAVDDPFWCSGDYKAATDLLERQCTLRALSSLAGRHPLAQLAYESVMPGKVVYPDGSSIWGGEGQLMGHPLSFPLLCVINLAVYRRALLLWADSLRRSGMRHRDVSEKVRIRWDAVLVNGDDILFKCDRTLYEYFIEVSKSAGLQISVGKNYLSPDMCMINSQVFHRRGVMRRFGYLNLKFITDSSLKTGESQATPVGIARDVQQMMDLAPWTKSVIPAVFGRWSHVRYLMPNFVPNWYMPCELGGFGLKPAGEVKFTRIQRKVAALFQTRPELALIAKSTADYSTFDVISEQREFQFVVGEVAPEAHLFPIDHTEVWADRLMMCRRAAKLVTEPGDWHAKLLSKRQLERLGYYRLAPMSQDSIETYRDAKVYASRGTPVPPLSVLNLSVARR